MTNAGVALGILIGIILMLWVVNLIRRDRLYIGYGVIFVVGILVALAVLIVRPLLESMMAITQALLPTPSLSLIALVIMLFLFVYIFAQITMLSNRVMRLTQELAIRTAVERRRVSDPIEHP